MCPEKLNDVLFTEGGVTTKVGGNKKACSILHAFTKYVLVVAQCRSIDWRCGARLLLGMYVLCWVTRWEGLFSIISTHHRISWSAQKRCFHCIHHSIES